MVSVVVTPTTAVTARTITAANPASTSLEGELSGLTLNPVTGLLSLRPEDQRESSYPEYLPVWDTSVPQEPAYSEVPYDDRASYADESLPTLFPPLKLASQEVGLKEITPKFGSVVKGVQLASLVDDPKAKDELALLIARRGVVVFHDQESFFKLGAKKLSEFFLYYGVLHQHPTSGNLEGAPEFHVVYKSSRFNLFDTTTGRTTSTSWHSDVSYELQPPSYSLLAMVDTPSSGGDTVFVDTTEAYNRLSPGFKERLHGLTATHSAIEQAEYSKQRRGVVRRAPVVNHHPLVRQHPVTKNESLYVDQGFTRAIDGYKKEESDALLGFLYNHLGSAVDYQMRVSWKQFTVVFWDNRVTLHSATADFDASKATRHAFRLMVRGEIPVEKATAELATAEKAPFEE